MSDEEVSETITAELKDGQLQIVEVTYDKENTGEEDDQEGENLQQFHELPEGEGSELEEGMKQYVHVVDESGNGLVQLDLLNLTFVRCGNDSENEYQLVTTDDVNDTEEGTSDEQTMTCVLDTSEGQNGPYMMVEGNDGLMFLQPDPVSVKPEPVTQKLTNTETKPLEDRIRQALKNRKGSAKRAMEEKKAKEQQITTQHLLERFKAIQKVRSVAPPPKHPPPRDRRRRASELPPPHELLAAPNFKLYLYSCKLCSFNCNAIKELTAHKKAEHSSGVGKWRGGSMGGRSQVNLQCARCPYRASTHPLLMKHAREKHLMEVILCDNQTQALPSASKANVTCSNCGYQADSSKMLKEHVEKNDCGHRFWNTWKNKELKKIKENN